MTASRILPFLALGLMIAPVAFADIGAVGSPVTPSNPPPAAPKPPVLDQANAPVGTTAVTGQVVSGLGNTPTVASAPQKPLLVIRFNQPSVSFSRALRQAVASAERVKTGVIYSVVSYVPQGAMKGENERATTTANDNLNAVLNEMMNAGVAGSRIGTSTLSSPAGGSQEIDIFVQ